MNEITTSKSVLKPLVIGLTEKSALKIPNFENHYFLGQWWVGTNIEVEGGHPRVPSPAITNSMGSEYKIANLDDQKALVIRS
jgi:hypothetical protein